jgi:cytochrome c oxidase accessory protein FixG
LFVVTALFGRVWCGFTCPQTVFMEGMFRRIERWIEGPRNQRIRRNLGPMTPDKFWRKALKHAVFLFLALNIAHIFLAYFIPLKDLAYVVRSSPAEHPSAFFWTMFWTAVLYFDFAWFREQTCLIICPYGRLQSALIDRDTIVIGYDELRGEPRHKGVREGGDCVDCYRCVEVCPTGIDIRNGLQMECIACTRCIDACDEVMRRIGKPEGLVRFDSERSFEGEGRRSLIRPRLFAYLFAGLVGLAVAGLAIGAREPIQANLLRSRGMPYLLEGQRIRNLYNLHVQNKTGEPAVYLIEVGNEERPGLEVIVPQTALRLDAGEDAELPIFAYYGKGDYDAPFPVYISVVDSASQSSRIVEATFRGP